MTDTLCRAILLLGPTGTGKTPFGQQLETRNLWSRKYHHFDFGENLRKAAESEGRLPGGMTSLTGEELSTVKSVLKSNTLLEDRDFPIAEKILSAFMMDRDVDTSIDVVILNGFPRHAGQAGMLQGILNVKLVIMFSAPPSVIYDRIKTNAGGDRTGRDDDSVDEIRKKLEIYGERTAPLVEYYKKLDRTVLDIAVEVDTIPLYIIQGLETMPSLV